MTIFLVITGFSLVFVDDNLFAFCLIRHCTGYGRALYIIANLKAIITNRKNLVKCHSTACLNIELLNSDNISF